MSKNERGGYEIIVWPDKVEVIVYGWYKEILVGVLSIPSKHWFSHWLYWVILVPLSSTNLNQPSHGVDPPQPHPNAHTEGAENTARLFVYDLQVSLPNKRVRSGLIQVLTVFPIGS